MTISKQGNELSTLVDWQTHAGPKLANQWKDGRSAKESAKAWLDVKHPALPPEIASLLTSNKAFGTVIKWDAEQEVRLPFDNFEGEPRNADFVVHAQDEHGKLALAIEAKADEPFGETVADALAAALDRITNNPRSNGIKRV